MRNLLLVLAGAACCLAQSPGWTTMGSGGSVTPKDGGILFAYELGPQQPAIAVLPTPDGIAHMQRLKLRVKASADTPVAVMLSEKKPGGNYIAFFWAPANAWQAVELTPADFAISDGRNEPVDPDGKLDLDQVEGVGVLDLAQLFRMQPEVEEPPIAIDRSQGPRTLEIAGFEIVGGPAAVSGRRNIDAFDRGFLEWITMGGVKLGLAPKSNPLGGAAMEAALAATEGRWGLLIRRVAHLDLAKAEYLLFDVASERETTLVVSLEMKDGQRFNQTVFPPGKREPFAVKLKLADFEGEGTFAPSQWKTIAIADSSGTPNTLWIAHMAVQ